MKRQGSYDEMLPNIEGSSQTGGLQLHCSLWLAKYNITSNYIKFMADFMRLRPRIYFANVESNRGISRK
jgi:hypothetical protein